MVHYLKYFLLAASLTGLAACDNSDQRSPEGENPAATESHSVGSPPADEIPATHSQVVSMIDGRITFNLPESFTEQKGGADVMRIYADMAKQHTLLVIITPTIGGAELLKSQLKATEESLKAQNAALEVINRGPVKAGNLDMQQLTMKMTVEEQSAYSYTALGIVNDQQLTLQFTSPVAEEAEFQKVINGTLASVKVQ